MTSRRRMTPAEIKASKERANKKRKLHRLWNSENTIDEICEEMDMDEDEVVVLATEMGLPEMPESCRSYIPTPEELRLACAAVRAGWTDAERDARRTGCFIDRIGYATDQHTCHGDAPRNRHKRRAADPDPV